MTSCPRRHWSRQNRLCHNKLKCSQRCRSQHTWLRVATCLHGLDRNPGRLMMKCFTSCCRFFRRSREEIASRGPHLTGRDCRQCVSKLSSRPFHCALRDVPSVASRLESSAPEPSDDGLSHDSGSSCHIAGIAVISSVGRPHTAVHCFVIRARRTGSCEAVHNRRPW